MTPKERDLMTEAYNRQVKLGMPHSPANWHVWKKAWNEATKKRNVCKCGATGFYAESHKDVTKYYCSNCHEKI